MVTRRRRMVNHVVVWSIAVVGALNAGTLVAQSTITTTDQELKIPAAQQGRTEGVIPDLKAPIEKLAKEIVKYASGPGQDAKNNEAELLASQAATALLEAGEILGLDVFIKAFYSELYPSNNVSGMPVWTTLDTQQKQELQSIEIQYLVIRSELLKYHEGLVKPASGLTSPAEILEGRRSHLEQLMDNIRVAQNSLFKRRKKISADRYRQMNSVLHTTSAQVSMSIADAGYRLRAASMVTSLTKGEPKINSSAYYGAARQSLFEALILDPDNVRAKALAAEIEERLEWLRTGRAFGGTRFFEVEPVMGGFDNQQWTPLARLQKVIDRLGNLSKGLPDVKERQKNLNEIVTNFITLLHQSRLRREDQLGRLSAEIADLQYRIQSSNIQAKDALNDRTKEARDRLAQSDVTRSDMQRRGKALDKQIEKKTDELRKTLNDLANLTSLGDLVDPLKFKTFANTAEKVLSDTRLLIGKVSEIDVDGIKTRAKKLKESFDRLQTASDTTVEQVKFELQRLEHEKAVAEKSVEKVAKSIELAKVGYFDQVAKTNIKSVESEIRTLKHEISQADLNTNQEIEKFSEKIYDITVGNFEREKARVERHITEVKVKIDRAKQLIDLYKKNKERVEEAIAAAQLAVEAAAAIPSGVIAGTASGTFTQKPQALMKIQELGLKIIDNAQKVAMDIRKAEEVLGDLNDTIEQYKDKFANIRNLEIKAEMEKRIRETEKIGDQLKQDLTKKLKAAEAQIATALQGSADRIEERFKISTAKLAANKAEFEAKVKAVEAEIRSNEARITAEQRKARALVDQIEILKGDLSRLTHEKQGILDSIKRAQARAHRDVDVIEARAALEAEQYNKMTGPLITRITHLQNMADKLALGGEAGSLRLPIEAMTVAAGGASIEDLTSERAALLDEGNRLLFQYANWLYLMSRDPGALEWAISARSPYELKLARKHLNKIYHQLKSTVGLATPRYFVARLSREALEKAFIKSDGSLPNKLVFTVNPSLASLETKLPEFARRDDLVYVGEEIISIYSPLEIFLDNQSAVAGTLNGSSEIIFAPFLESEPGAHHLLWDVWVIPNWRTAEPPELSMVGLKPLGPTYYRINDETRGHPVLRNRDSNTSSTAYSYDRLRQQHELAMRHITAGTGNDLISGTLPGMNYRSLLGRGLGNTWELTAPKEWSDLNDHAPGFNSLDSIDVVFGYLISPERPRGQGVASRDISETLQKKKTVSTRGCDTVLLRWLCALQEIRSHEERAKKYVKRMENAIKTSTGEKDLSKASGDARATYDFQKSPGARILRLQVLSEMADALPRAIQLSQRTGDERDKIPVLDVWFRESGKESIRVAFIKTFCIGESSDSACRYRNSGSQATYADLTHEIVRDEMLSWSDAMAAPVGPLELMRTWRSVEALFGNVKADQTVDDVESRRSTLLADMREIAGKLRASQQHMSELRKNVNGPIAVARRMVTEYGLSRMQIDFVDQFARAISNTSDMTAEISDTEKASLSELITKLPEELAPYHCAQRWYAAAAKKDTALSLSSFSGQAADRLINALEPDLEYLLSPADPEPLVLKSFPFPECKGIFIDAFKK